jgi:gluconate:H+ symporter, GntP family
MYGMPLAQALVFVALVAAVVAATRRCRVHPFLALILVASVFGAAAGFSVSLIGKSFGNGFAQAIHSPGLTIVAAAFVAGLAESAGASSALRAAAARRRWLSSGGLWGVVGFIGGIASAPASALALLTPPIHGIAGATPKRGNVATATALAISGSHALVLFSPVPMVAGSILGASWGKLALFGTPIAIVLVVVGFVWSRSFRGTEEIAPAPSANDQPAETAPASSSWRPVASLVLATIIPLTLLMVQSLGDIPSEPLGGGPARELIIGLGRPLVLFWAALGIMAVCLAGPVLKSFGDATWTGRILAGVAAPLLVVGAAGGLQSLCQETSMADSLGERLLGLHGGVLIPFLVAAVMKALQGSSLVATITAAGMIEPTLGPLGLAGESGKVLATLAIGAGTMTASHINDEFFWVAAHSARLSTWRAVVAITGGTLLQGLVAVALLLVVSLIVPGL